jgi:hypothetical protein
LVNQVFARAILKALPPDPDEAGADSDISGTDEGVKEESITINLK